MASNSVETIYTAVTKGVTFATPNSALDGSGAIATLITGSDNGTFVKTLIVKSQETVSEGMVRLFIKSAAGTYRLIRELYVPPTVCSSRDLSFGSVVPLNYQLGSGEVLGVSTQTANTFNAVVEAFDISFSTSTVFLGSTAEFITAGGNTVVQTANSNRNGSGALQNLVTASTTAGFCGLMINSLIVKSQVTTNPGMVRFFLDISGTKYLFSEVCVPSHVNGSSIATFGYQVIGAGSLCLQPGVSIFASTQNSEAFSIVCEGANWKHV